MLRHHKHKTKTTMTTGNSDHEKRNGSARPALHTCSHSWTRTRTCPIDRKGINKIMDTQQFFVQFLFLFVKNCHLKVVEMCVKSVAGRELTSRCCTQYEFSSFTFLVTAKQNSVHCLSVIWSELSDISQAKLYTACQLFGHCCQTPAKQNSVHCLSVIWS